MPRIVRYLVKIAIGFCILIGIFLLYVMFGDMPFGIQLVTLISYSVAIFFYVFCNTRFLRGFDFYSEASKRSVSRLLSIHTLFSILIFAIQTLALKFGSTLPSWWVRKSGPKNDSPLEFGLFMLFFVMGTIEVVSFRRILSKAEKEGYSN